MIALLGFLARYGRRYKGSVALVFIGLLLENAFAVAVPMSFQLLVDHALAQDAGSLLPTVFAGLFLGLVAASAAGVGRDYVFAWLGTIVLNDIRIDMFNQLQRLSMDFYRHIRIGEIMVRFLIEF